MRRNFDPRNTHEKKIWTHEILTRKTFGPTKLDPREKIWTHEIPKRRNLDPLNTDEEIFGPKRYPR